MSEDLLLIPLYFIMGAVAAVIATMSGVGGGVFFVPMFSLLLGYPIPLAVGTSKGVVAVVTSFGSLSYLREKLVKPADALVIAASMVPSSIAGALLVAYVEPRLIEILVGGFVTIYGVRLIYRTFRAVKESRTAIANKPGNKAMDPRHEALLKIAAGVIAGLVAGLTGTGGGAILVPILTTLLRMNLKRAVATSTLAIFPGSIAAAMVHAATETLVYSTWTIVAPGALMGAILGPKIVSRIRITLMRPIVGIVLILVGLRLALS